MPHVTAQRSLYTHPPPRGDFLPVLASMSEAEHGVQGGTNAGLRAWGIGEVVSLGASANSKTKQVCVLTWPHDKSRLALHHLLAFVV